MHPLFAFGFAAFACMASLVACAEFALASSTSSRFPTVRRFHRINGAVCLFAGVVAFGVAFVLAA